MNPVPDNNGCGVLRGIAHRPVDGEPMVESREAQVLAGRGIESENRKPGKREITLISAKSWADACRELGVEIPWHARRANLLVDGVDLPKTIGLRLKIGLVEILVHGETKPCRIMDQQREGLREALVPEFRGGVHGQVLTGGTLRVGDPVQVL